MPHPPDHDPDAQGLPPGTELPERRAYARGQLRGLMVSNAVGLLVLLALWGLFRGAGAIWGPCAAIMAVLLVVNWIRWIRVGRRRP